MLGASMSATSQSAAHATVEPIAEPAQASHHASRRPLIGIATAGNRLVAVGVQGHILYSDDLGQQWTQATVPVSNDLTAVSFPTPEEGWAVGHDGVVLRSSDGGAKWSLVLEGRRAARLMLDYYQAAPAGDATSAALDESKRFVSEQGARPFLDVAFADKNNGFIVGAWGLILRTSDGGRTWEPWLHKLSNPGASNLNAIRLIHDTWWVAGDQGLLARLDPGKDRFETAGAPEGGSFFGLTSVGNGLIAYGIVGRALRSADGGKRWERITGLGAAAITGGTVLDDGRVVLTDMGATIWVSPDGGRDFKRAVGDRPMPYTGAAALPGGRLALTGLSGVRTQAIGGSAANGK